MAGAAPKNQVGGELPSSSPRVEERATRQSGGATDAVEGGTAAKEEEARSILPDRHRRSAADPQDNPHVHQVRVHGNFALVRHGTERAPPRQRTGF
jgi:hypothetical protein